MCKSLCSHEWIKAGLIIYLSLLFVSYSSKYWGYTTCKIKSLFTWNLHHPATCFFFLSIFYWLRYYSCPNFSPLSPSTQYPPSLWQSPPWLMSMVVHIISLVFPFLILFLASLCLFFSLPIMLLNPYTFCPILPLPPTSC